MKKIGIALIVLAAGVGESWFSIVCAAACLIAGMAHNDTRIYWAREVTFDYSTEHPIRVDYMRFKPVNNTVSGIEKGDFYCYEVKSSVEDFHSKNGHNFIGEFNYYVMPEDVYEKVKNEIP